MVTYCSFRGRRRLYSQHLLRALLTRVLSVESYLEPRVTPRSGTVRPRGVTSTSGVRRGDSTAAHLGSNAENNYLNTRESRIGVSRPQPTLQINYRDCWLRLSSNTAAAGSRRSPGSKRLATANGRTPVTKHRRAGFTTRLRGSNPCLSVRGGGEHVTPRFGDCDACRVGTQLRGRTYLSDPCLTEYEYRHRRLG